MKALVTAPFHELGFKILKKYMGVTYENWRETGVLYRDSREYIEKINKEKADVLITEGDMIDGDVLSSCDIKIIGICRGYPDNVDMDVATKKGIPVFFTPDRNADAVADLSIGLMICQLRHMTTSDRLLRSGTFFVDTGEGLADLYRRFMGWELGGKTVGIVGLGGVGFRVAKRLKFGFDVKILVHDPYVDEKKIKEVDGKRVDLETLLKESDLVSLHAKVTGENVGMIGEKELKLMKPTAYFFNTARAALVDEDALFEALKEKRIAGAGLDVFGSEPVDSDNRFLPLDNVTVTPHAGGSTFDAEIRQSLMIAEDIESYLKKKKPKFLKNPEVLKR
ncbi:MAG: 3-phosphoglycerate dehydrogenase [Euryarchaeota archaeon]|nr:3-phosphoglycerate dehydrogenase [Euryarchaeota archaeon]